MISAQQLEALDPQVRQAMLSLMAEVAARDEQLRAKDTLIEQRERDAAFKQALIDKLTHEVAVLKRMKFAATSEKFAGSAEQKSLLEETLDEDLAELYREIKRLGADGDAPGDKAGKKTPKRQALLGRARSGTARNQQQSDSEFDSALGRSLTTADRSPF